MCMLNSISCNSSTSYSRNKGRICFARKKNGEARGRGMSVSSRLARVTCWELVSRKENKKWKMVWVRLGSTCLPSQPSGGMGDNELGASLCYTVRPGTNKKLSNQSIKLNLREKKKRKKKTIRNAQLAWNWQHYVFLKTISNISQKFSYFLLESILKLRKRVFIFCLLFEYCLSF